MSRHVWVVALALVWVGCGDESTSGSMDESPELDSGDTEASLEEGAEEDANSPWTKAHDYSELEDVCGLDTGYPGDILCLLPPDEEEGFQLYLGPENLDDPVEVEEYLLGAGEETTKCFYTFPPNEKLVAYYDRLIHMRPVSHHLILYTQETADDLWPDGIPSGYSRCRGGDVRNGSLGGAETPRAQYPPNGDYAPENMGVGRALAPGELIQMNQHAINTSDKAVLLQVWVNVLYKDISEVTQPVIDINVLGGFSVNTQPWTHEVMNNVQDITTYKRPLSMFGHYHAHTVRFSAWRNRGDEHLLVLEDYDWFDPITINFSSTFVNTEPDPEKRTPGGHTGILEFDEGDQLEWECEVFNDSDEVLTYSNEAITGEMCNLFGEFVGHGAGWTVGGERGNATVLGTIDH